MNVIENKDLTAFNTLNLPCIANKYCVIHRASELLEYAGVDDLFVLGGGSNIVLPARLNCLVLHNQINFIESEAISPKHVKIRIGAGVNWHRLVTICVKLGWGGIENLARIPGSVGAAPVQNIGAYGVEIKDVLSSVRAFDRLENRFVDLDNASCQFGYRNSIFKSTYKDRYIVTSIELELNKATEAMHFQYDSLRKECEKRNILNPSIQEVFDMVVAIRSSKLPDPVELSNAGSFFKNPVIDRKQFYELKNSFPEVKHYNMPDDKIKIPAGYLIEQCGYKGRRNGPVGCYEKQALVIVNHGGATSEDVKGFVKEVKSVVFDKFGIRLVEEVNIIKPTC